MYLALLKTNGKFVIVGVPPEPFELSSFTVIFKRLTVGGSLIGGIAELPPAHEPLLTNCWGVLTPLDGSRLSLMKAPFDRGCYALSTRPGTSGNSRKSLRTKSQRFVMQTFLWKN
jgi:hypothetical protein